MKEPCLHCVYGAVVGGMLAVVGVLYLIRIKVRSSDKVVTKGMFNTNHCSVQGRACRLPRKTLFIVRVSIRVVAALAALLAD